jgi:ATP-dependent helicase HrpB
MDHWETVEISNSSALQRQGRAGRLGPGICLRWERANTVRRNFSPPEILTADLTPLVLETALWGAASPTDLVWITPPPVGALRQAIELLKRLDMIDTGGRISTLGRQAAGLGIHPRLGRMLLHARTRGFLATAALTCAILAEGDPLGGNDPDFRDRLVAWKSWKNGEKGAMRMDAAQRITREAERIIRAAGGSASQLDSGSIEPELAGNLLLFAYPDRAAQRSGPIRPGETARLVLATGRAARVAGALAQEEFLVIADMDGGDTEARVFLAAPVARGDIESGLAGQPIETNHFSWEGWRPERRAEITVGRIVLGEKPGSASSPEELRQAARERILREGIGKLPWNDEARRFLARCRFAGKYAGHLKFPDFTDETLSEDIEEWLFPFGNWGGRGKAVFTEDSLQQALAARLGWEGLHELDRQAPESVVLPSGTKKRLDYNTGDIPIVAARLQEFFGCRETPRAAGEPLLLHLLSPAGRPIQITRDIDGFWERAYPEVRKELRGRYPKHHWPDDPRTAAPTARTKKRG